MRGNALIRKWGLRENAFIAKMGVHENAFIVKMGSCENALLLQKELRPYFYFYGQNKSSACRA